MSHELLCSWLSLEPGEWPPNHYRLLGLPLGDTANPDGGAFVRVAREVGKSAKQVERIFYKQRRLAGR